MLTLSFSRLCHAMPCTLIYEIRPSTLLLDVHLLRAPTLATLAVRRESPRLLKFLHSRLQQTIDEFQFLHTRAQTRDLVRNTVWKR